MENKEFYKKINEYIKQKSKEEIIEFVDNLIRKIPESKYEEIICMTNSENGNINEEEIKAKIKKYKAKFKKIEEGELCFHARQDEDYSDWYYYDNWKVEYSDFDNVGGFIEEVAEYAISLVNFKQYKYAKELLDMIVEANYQVDDDERGEIFEISLLEMEQEDLIPISIKTLCSYIIYVTYQTSENKVQKIFDYYEDNRIFRQISIEDSFKLGAEKLTQLDNFYLEWISFLSKIKGELAYRLLKEALIYTEFNGYEKYINKIIENQPKICIEIFDYLKEKNKIKELIDLGNKALQNMHNELKIGSNIALYLANIDTERKEEYLCKAFSFDTSVLNLLRIINNGYLEKNKDFVKEKIANCTINNNYRDNNEHNVIDDKTYYLLRFFVGDFAGFLEESLKHTKVLGWTGSFEKISVYLWLLLLNENKEKTKAFSNIIKDVFSELGYSEKESQLLENNISEIWNKWKSNFKVDENIKNKAVKWLNLFIEDRVDAIMKGNYRTSYYKVALIIVAYAEMISSQNLGSKEGYIQYFASKYSRRSSFKEELREYYKLKK